MSALTYTDHAAYAYWLHQLHEPEDRIRTGYKHKRDEEPKRAHIPLRKTAEEMREDERKEDEFLKAKGIIF